MSRHHYNNLANPTPARTIINREHANSDDYSTRPSQTLPRHPEAFTDMIDRLALQDGILT